MVHNGVYGTMTITYVQYLPKYMSFLCKLKCNISALHDKSLGTAHLWISGSSFSRLLGLPSLFNSGNAVPKTVTYHLEQTMQLHITSMPSVDVVQISLEKSLHFQMRHK